MTTTTYYWTLTLCARCRHAAGPLQAKQKSNHWCEIKPVQEKNLKYFFQKCITFFCLNLQSKQNLFLKGHWENLKIGGVPKQTKWTSWRNKRFSMLCLGENKIKGRKKVSLCLVHLLSKSFPNNLSETGFILKSSALWADAFYKLKCPSVCPCVCMPVCVFTFEVPF